MVSYTPEAGHIVWLDFEPQAGREIQKTRPALVVSPKSYNQKVGLMLAMPITSKIKGYPFEVVILYENIQGAILSDQIRSLDFKARNARYILTLEKALFLDVMAKFSLLLPEGA